MTDQEPESIDGAMRAARDHRDELTRDIAFALKQSPFKTKGQPIESLTHVARGVVAHLTRAGWRFEFGPPAEAHGPALGRAPPGPETRG
ncbi:MAG: hypothetical protein R3D27_11460 [Hyphomicrobiaceae bacterium]